MKRASKEYLNDTTVTYLEKRKYTNMPRKKKSISLNDAAVTMAIETDIGVSSSVRLASISEPHLGEEQFTRLVHFVKDAPEEHLATLKQVLYPVFICMYINLLVSGLRPAAYALQQKHKTIFARLPEYKSSMDIVTAVVKKTGPNLQSLGKSLHQELGETKFSIEFSRETFNYLSQYFAMKDNSMILEVFNNNISIEVIGKRGAEGPLINDLSLLQAKPKQTVSESNDSGSRPSLMVVSNQVQQAVSPPVPDVRLYSISSTSTNNVNCGLVTLDRMLLGCSDSSIQIWPRNRSQFTSQKMSTNTHKNPISHLTLQPDNSSDLEPSAAGSEADSYTSSSDSPSSPPYVMRGHSSPVYDIQVFDKSPYAISCSSDCTIRLWDTDTLCNKVLYNGHTKTVWSLAVGNSSDYFASASADKSAKLWTTERTFPLRTFVGHTSSVDSVVFHPNLNYLATGSRDKTIRLWSVQSGACVRLFQGHRSNVFSLSISPDGKLVASAGEDRRIKLWDLASGDLITEFKGHTDVIHCLRFNSNGTLLCSGGMDGAIHVWDVKKSSESSSPVTSYTSDGSIISMTLHDPNVLEAIAKV